MVSVGSRTKKKIKNDGGKKLNRYLMQHWVLSRELGKWYLRLVRLRGSYQRTCRIVWGSFNNTQGDVDL